MSVAIVIPYYKYDFFEATLQSLARQTNQNFHVYIGDDASLIPPTDLLHKYQGQFAFSYHRFEHNLGGKSLVQQWERCMDMAKYEEWIMILGDDDVIETDFIASFYNNLKEIERLDINVIRYATIVIDENGNKVTPIYTHPKLEKATDFYQRKFTNLTRSSLSEYIFRKEILLKIKFKDLPLAWYSDLLAVLEVSFFNIIFTINESVVSFRHSNLNISGESKSHKIKNLAAFEFYYYLLNKKSQHFNCFQKELIFSSLEKTILDNKKQVHFWLKLCYLYFLFNKLNRILSLPKKIKQSIK